VKRLTMLVTAEGEWVLEDSAEFRDALGDPEPDYDAGAFAVKNLGFIKLQILDNSVIEVDLHPRNTQLPALLAVQQQILSSRVKLFRIKYFETSWHSEIMISAEQTISRLSELCSPEVALLSSERFLVEPKDYSELFNSDEQPLRPLAQKWRMSFGHFDPSVISFAIKHQILTGMMVVGVQPRKKDPIFRFIGDEHNWLGKSYHMTGVGEKVENQPDKEFGTWVSEFYKSVASSGQPRYDLVTALVQYQGETGRPRRVVRYERLLLPWKTPTDEVFVTLSKLVENKAASRPVSFEPESSAAESAVAMKLPRSS
jgi:hypothetical protein